MKAYINLRPSHNSMANRRLRRIGALLDAGETRRDQWVPDDCDLLIQWGFKPSTSLMSQIERGKPYAIIDLGYFDDTRMDRFSVSFNGLHGTAMPDTRVLDRYPRPMPQGYADWRDEPGKKVIVCGQMPLDQSLRGQDIDAWMGRAAVEAAETWKLPVYKRPHPKMINPWEPQPEPLSEALKDAHACVTWTSTAAIASVIAGVPTIAGHSGSMAYDMASQDMTICTPPGRQAWLHSIAWREWNLSSAQDLDRLAEHIIEMYPEMCRYPLDNPRNKL
jgi:hypothetical protein